LCYNEDVFPSGDSARAEVRNYFFLLKAEKSYRLYVGEKLIFLPFGDLYTFKRKVRKSKKCMIGLQEL
jgi:hypothetical protein